MLTHENKVLIEQILSKQVGATYEAGYDLIPNKKQSVNELVLAFCLEYKLDIRETITYLNTMFAPYRQVDTKELLPRDSAKRSNVVSTYLFSNMAKNGTVLSDEKIQEELDNFATISGYSKKLVNSAYAQKAEEEKDTIQALRLIEEERKVQAENKRKAEITEFLKKTVYPLLQNPSCKKGTSEYTQFMQEISMALEMPEEEIIDILDSFDKEANTKQTSSNPYDDSDAR